MSACESANAHASWLIMSSVRPSAENAVARDVVWMSAGTFSSPLGLPTLHMRPMHMHDRLDAARSAAERLVNLRVDRARARVDWRVALDRAPVGDGAAHERRLPHEREGAALRVHPEGVGVDGVADRAVA